VTDSVALATPTVADQLAGVRVLIVEDEPGVRRLLRTWLEAEGMTVFDAATAEQGLVLLDAETDVAVAVCDIRLPGNDGLWMAEQL